MKVELLKALGNLKIEDIEKIF